MLENSSKILKGIKIPSRFFEQVKQFEIFGDDSNKLIIRFWRKLRGK
jgi:hypothetical protein